MPPGPTEPELLDPEPKLPLDAPEPPPDAPEPAPDTAPLPVPPPPSSSPTRPPPSGSARILPPHPNVKITQSAARRAPKAMVIRPRLPVLRGARSSDGHRRVRYSARRANDNGDWAPGAPARRAPSVPPFGELLEGFALGGDAEDGRGDAPERHQPRADQVGVEDARALARLHERPEERRRDEPPATGPHGVKERDGHPSELHGEKLAHREVRRARRRRGDEERAAPEQRLCRGREPAAEQPEPGGGDERRRDRVGDRDHRAPPDAIEQPAERDRPEQVRDGERDQVKADAVGHDVVKADEDERVREEHAVVRERLRHHERQAERRPSRVTAHQLAGDRAEGDGPF